MYSFSQKKMQIKISGCIVIEHNIYVWTSNSPINTTMRDLDIFILFFWCQKKVWDNHLFFIPKCMNDLFPKQMMNQTTNNDFYITSSPEAPNCPHFCIICTVCTWIHRFCAYHSALYPSKIPTLLTHSNRLKNLLLSNQY